MSYLTIGQLLGHFFHRVCYIAFDINVMIIMYWWLTLLPFAINIVYLCFAFLGILILIDGKDTEIGNGHEVFSIEDLNCTVF